MNAYMWCVNTDEREGHMTQCIPNQFVVKQAINGAYGTIDGMHLQHSSLGCTHTYHI